MFGHEGRITRKGGGFRNPFKDGRQIADRYAFGQKVLQNALNPANGNLTRYDVLDQFFLVVVELVQKLLGFGIGQKFGHVVP